jgi:N-acetylmuramoyl-L-alanine amidase
MSFWQREKMRLAEMLLGPRWRRHRGMAETMLAQRAAAIRASDDSAPAAQAQRGGAPSRSAASPPVRVVINPGHALNAPGAQGQHINEAQVTGPIGDLMPPHSDNRVRYVVSRQPDADLPGYLSQVRADPQPIFLSIHLDAPRTDRREVKAYYWSEDPDPVRRAASQQLAECVGAALGGLSAYDTHRVVAAPYPRDGRLVTPGVLRNTATCAAILVEAGFITNPQTEAFVRTQEGRQQIADAIHQGIQNYLDSPQQTPSSASAPGSPESAGRGAPATATGPETARGRGAPGQAPRGARRAPARLRPARGRTDQRRR